ncbi:zf-HC2 domain-containing protein [Paenibacillus aurantiacus]|uniref:Anti-sigma-W factor RsiW n=1 Tax=Paenibacillus aurantiacus TaxID=1936118 RepID=A0ABV5KP73_9BACL
MKGTPCEIIRDLLPLYADEVCSEVGARWVEAHLAECPRCRSELANIQTVIRLPETDVMNNYNEAAGIKEIAVKWRRSRVKALLTGLLAAALLFGIYVGLTQWQIMKVPAASIRIHEVSRLSDGRIVYQAKVIDGYEINRIRYEMDEEGNFYLTPLRPVIKRKALSERLQSMYETLEHESYVYKENFGQQAEMTAIYFRTSDEDILIWKKGMDLPAASDAVEAEFHPGRD